MSEVLYTQEMFVPIMSLVPTHAGQWGLDDSEWREEWGVRRRMSFMPWNDHRVAEGHVNPNSNGLKRALWDEGVTP